MTQPVKNLRDAGHERAAAAQGPLSRWDRMWLAVPCKAVRHRALSEKLPWRLYGIGGGLVFLGRLCYVAVGESYLAFGLPVVGVAILVLAVRDSLATVEYHRSFPRREIGDRQGHAIESAPLLGLMGRLRTNYVAFLEATPQPRAKLKGLLADARERISDRAYFQPTTEDEPQHSRAGED